MDQATCERLIRTVAFGRIASTHHGLPKIVPVHCTVRGGEIVLGSIQAHKSVRVLEGDVVAFEADSYDPAACEGWSVGVVAPCRVVTDEVEIKELDALGFTPWTFEDGGRYIGLPLELISGRALSRRR
nr:pyridoxamine 5'-phosphate oxidase family protein [Petropleomorpha daqingensis]